MNETEFEELFDEATEPPELPEITATDDGNALRLVAERGEVLRRVADMRKWFVWDGCRWALAMRTVPYANTRRSLLGSCPRTTRQPRAVQRTWQPRPGRSCSTSTAQ